MKRVHRAAAPLFRTLSGEGTGRRMPRRFMGDPANNHGFLTVYWPFMLGVYDKPMIEI